MKNLQPVTKVIFFIYKLHKESPRFLVIKHLFGTVAPTGHVGDTVPGESFEAAAGRETREEFGVEPLSVTDLAYSSIVELVQAGKLSTEHAFLVRIPDTEVTFLEGTAPIKWVLYEDLGKTLSFKHQKEAAERITPDLFGQPVS